MYGIIGLVLVGFLASQELAAQTNPFKRNSVTGRKAGTVTQEQLTAAAVNIARWKEAMDILRVCPELHGIRNLTTSQLIHYGRLKSTRPDLDIRWDETGSVPIYISATSLVEGYSNLKGTGPQHAEIASRFLREYRDLLRINGPEDFVQWSTVTSAERAHVKYRQIVDGVEIWGKEIILHFNARGDLDLMTGRYVPSPPKPVMFKSSIAGEAAITIALDDLAGKTSIGPLSPLVQQLLDYSSPTVRTILFTDDAKTVPRPAYVIEIRPNLIDWWRYFIDAETGGVLRAYNATCADGPAKATATDLLNIQRTIDTYQFQNTYWMIDASRQMFNATKSKFPNETVGAIVTLDARNTDLKDIFHLTSTNNNTWTDKSSVSAHYHAGLTYEYFRSRHNRNGIDGKGSTIYSVVNVTQSGQSMSNAFWNGKLMAYGNGGPLGFGPFAGSLDIGAHEMAHGVTENSAALEYLFQAGALNEAFSDIFGCMVDRDDWKILDDVTPTNANFPNGAARDLSNPHNGGTPGSPAWQPKHMNEYQNMGQDQDNGGVHINSGIPNHAAYLISEQITRDKAEKIFYCALTTKLTKQSKFIDFRLALVKCAEELYGANSAEVNACKSGCDQVGITDGNPTKNPDDLPEVNGPDQMIFLSTDPTDRFFLWKVKLPGQPNDYSSLTATPVLRKPSVSDDGTYAVFVDAFGNLRGITLNISPPQEGVIDNSGFWKTVTLSKNQKLIALTTTITGDNKIHVFDVSTATPRLKSFQIYTPSYSGSPVPNVALFADAMDFTHDNTSLLFDCYNEVFFSGEKIGFWEINLMSVWSGSDFTNGLIYRIFPQEPRVNVGNPVFAKNKPTVFAFDMYLPDNQEAYIVAVDALEGTPHQIAQLNSEFGHPSYRGDDRMLSYGTETVQGSYIFNVELEADAMTPKGSPVAFVPLAQFPVWYRTGTRPVSVGPAESIMPKEVTLSRNFPNPFNPSTTIRYSLPERMHVTLTVYDVMGREMQTLVSGPTEAGVHSAFWNGRDRSGAVAPSGIYFYRLTAGAFVSTKTMTLLK